MYVFTIPKILRGFFRRNRYLLGDLARCAWQAIKDFFQAIDPRATPGAVICIQTAGNLLGWHPHLHAIVTNGYFVDDAFHPLSGTVLREGQNILVQLFRDNVLQMLQDKGVLSQTLAQTILTWRHHSGFSVHTEVFIPAGDREGIEKLGRYIMRNPVAQERLSINPDGSILYRSTKVDPNFKGNFRLFKDPLEFLAEVLQHLFPKNFQSTRYYGRYSNASRAKRNRDQETTEGTTVETQEPLNRVPHSVRKAWARLIAKVYQINPFICPRCGAEMHIKKFILIQDEIQYILNTLGIPFLPRGQPAVNTTNNSDGDYVIVPIEDI